MPGLGQGHQGTKAKYEFITSSEKPARHRELLRRGGRGRRQGGPLKTGIKRIIF